MLRLPLVTHNFWLKSLIMYSKMVIPEIYAFIRKVTFTRKYNTNFK